MKKKFVCILLALCISFTIYGCKKSEPIDSAKVDTTSETNEIDKKDNVSASGLTSSEIIPDPYDFFVDGASITASLYDDPDTRYEIEGFKEEEYNNYIDDCFSDGTLEITYRDTDENGETIYAYDKNEEFFIEIYMHEDEGTLTISSHLRNDGITSEGETTSQSIPDPADYFKSAEEIDDTYVDTPYTLYNIKGYTLDELEKYIKACQEKGFTESVLDNIEDGSGSFYAERDDGELYMDITANYDNSAVGISCDFL